MSETTNYNVSGSNTIIAKTTAVNVFMSVSDNYCGQNYSVYAVNASVVGYTTSGVWLSVGMNETHFSTEITDCVGWESINDVFITRKDTIPAPLISNEQFIKLNGSYADSGRISSFYVFVSDPLELGLTCQINTGSVACDKVGQQRWQVNISNAVQDGALTLNVSDSIGNYRTILLQLDVDITARCVLDSILVAGINYVALRVMHQSCVDDNLGKWCYKVPEVQWWSDAKTTRSPELFIRCSNQPLGHRRIQQHEKYEYTIVEDTTAPDLTSCVFGNSTLNDGAYSLMNNGGIYLQFIWSTDLTSTIPSCLTIEHNTNHSHIRCSTSFTTQQIVLPSLTDGRLIRVIFTWLMNWATQQHWIPLRNGQNTSFARDSTNGRRTTSTHWNSFVHDQGYLVVRSTDKNNVSQSWNAIHWFCTTKNICQHHHWFVNTPTQACEGRMQATIMSVGKTVAKRSLITGLTEQHLNSL